MVDCNQLRLSSRWNFAALLEREMEMYIYFQPDSILIVPLPEGQEERKHVALNVVQVVLGHAPAGQRFAAARAFQSYPLEDSTFLQEVEKLLAGTVLSYDYVQGMEVKTSINLTDNGELRICPARRSENILRVLERAGIPIRTEYYWVELRPVLWDEVGSLIQTVCQAIGADIPDWQEEHSRRLLRACQEAPEWKDTVWAGGEIVRVRGEGGVEVAFAIGHDFRFYPDGESYRIGPPSSKSYMVVYVYPPENISYAEAEEGVLEDIVDALKSV